MKMFSSRGIFLALVLWGQGVSMSEAARLGQVEVDILEVYEQPSSESEVVGKLKRGQKIAVSNLPVAGFHKIRMPGGTLGWVPLEALAVGPMPDVLAVQEAYADAGLSAPTDAATSDGSSRSEFRPEIRSRLRVFGGGHFFKMTEVAQVTGFEDSPIGAYFGAEFTFPITETMSLGLRGQQTRKVTTVKDAEKEKVYRFSAQSTPLMAGAGFEYFVPGLSLTWGWSIYGGLATATELTAKSLSDDLPNETTLSSSGLAALAQVNGAWYATDTFGIFLELGYLFVQTSRTLPTDPIGNGAEIFKKNNKFVPTDLSMSGWIMGGGLSFRF